MPLMSLVVIPWYWHLQNAAVSTSPYCIFTIGPFWAFFIDSDSSTWCQALTSLYNANNPGASNSTEAAASWMTSSCPSRCSSWTPHVFKTSTGDLHSTKLGCQHKVLPWPLWTTAAMFLAWGTLPENFPQWCCSLFFNLSWFCSPSWPILILIAKQRFHFSGFNSKYHINVTGRVFAPFLNFTSLASINRAALSIILYVPTIAH